MSSTIKLYEHTQTAYDALLDMLGERDRACVIKPTGTGKFVIIAKMVQDNPDKRFLLLGTNDYMFNDQMANLTEIAPGFTPENLQFMTYSAAMMAAVTSCRVDHLDIKKPPFFCLENGTSILRSERTPGQRRLDREMAPVEIEV